MVLGTDEHGWMSFSPNGTATEHRYSSESETKFIYRFDHDNHIVLQYCDGTRPNFSSSTCELSFKDQGLMTLHWDRVEDGLYPRKHDWIIERDRLGRVRWWWCRLTHHQ